MCVLCFLFLMGVFFLIWRGGPKKYKKYFWMTVVFRLHRRCKSSHSLQSVPMIKYSVVRLTNFWELSVWKKIITKGNKGVCFIFKVFLPFPTVSDLSALWLVSVQKKICLTVLLWSVLQEDDLETLQMSYTSYSENKISKSMVAHFIGHLILKYREPRFLDVSSKRVY